MDEKNYSCQKKPLKKKLLVFVLVAVILLTAVFTSYNLLGISALKKATWNYLYSQGYKDDEIESVRIDHSYIAGILGYGQWKTEVVFKDEPYISYTCIIRGKLSLRVTGLYAASFRGYVSENYDFMHDMAEQDCCSDLSA